MSRRLLLAVSVVAMVLVPGGAAAGGFCHPEPGLEMTSSSKPSVRIAGCAFGATVTYVEPGAGVTWVSRDVYPHTVTGAALSWGTRDILERGDEVTYAFEDEGVYPYYCDLHPSMVGAVVVGDATSTAMLDGSVTKVEDAAPVAALGDTPSDPGNGLPAVVVALAGVAALVAVVVGTRAALGRRVAGSA